MEVVKIERYLRNVSKYVYSTMILGTALVFLLLGMVLAFLYVYLRELKTEEISTRNLAKASVTVTPGLADGDNFYYLSKNRLYAETNAANAYSKSLKSTVREGFTLESFLGEGLWSYSGPASGNQQESGIYNVYKDEYLPVNINLESGYSLKDAVFVSAERYVYTASYISNTDAEKETASLHIFLHDQGSDYQLTETALTVSSALGYTPDKVNRLMLSPDKDKVLYINTTAPQKNLKIYDLITRQLAADITNIYTADWKDSNVVIYQDQNKELRDLNLLTRQGVLIEKMENSLTGMHYYQGQIIFWKYDADNNNSTVYSYKFSSGQTKLLLDNATMPLWLAEGKLVAVTFVKEQIESAGELQLIGRGLAVIDITNNTVTALEDTMTDSMIQNIFSNINAQGYNESLLSIN